MKKYLNVQPSAEKRKGFYPTFFTVAAIKHTGKDQFVEEGGHVAHKENHRGESLRQLLTS